MMKLVSAVLVIGLLALLAPSAVGQQGFVCVAPNSTQRPTRISPGGDYNPTTLSVKTDKGRLVLWPHKEGLRIADLDLNERHLVTLVSDGKAISSFWFKFSQYKSQDLCLSFDGYQGPQLQEIKSSPWCKCK